MKMRTDQLIAVLAQADSPNPRFGFGAVICAVVIVSLLITAMLLGLRPEILHMTLTWHLVYKAFLLLGLTLLCGGQLKAASSPLSRPLASYWFGLLGAFCFVAIAFEWSTRPADAILGQFSAINFPACLIAVSVYGACGVIALTSLMRLYAPTDLRKASAWIGVTAAAAAALGYSFHCPFDSPTFILIAYGLPVASLTALCWAVLPKFLTW